MPIHTPIGCTIIFTEPDLFLFSSCLLETFLSAPIHPDDEGRLMSQVMETVKHCRLLIPQMIWTVLTSHVSQ